MSKKGLLFFSLIITMGILDWLTTATGILFFGATESNPLMAPLTSSNLAIFSTIKLSAIVLAGLVFYKAAALITAPGSTSRFNSRFLNSGYSATFLALTVVVANNMLVILKP
jgi:hypothetical protein